MDELFEEQEGMDPDVAFGVELGRLRDALHGGHLRQKIRQQAGLIEQLETAARATLGENAHQLIANALGGNAQDGGVIAAKGVKGARFDGESEAGGEADGAQQAQMIFLEARIGIADGADDAAFQVRAAVDEIENLAAGPDPSGGH